MLKSVIYIKYSPLTKKVSEDYCMESLVNNGYHVEYWDITKLYKFGFQCLEPFYPQYDLVVRCVESYKELKKLISSNRNSFFVLLMTCRLNQYKLLSLLTHYNVTTAFWGPAPLYYTDKPIVDRLKGFTFTKLRNRLEEYLMHLILRAGLVNYYNYYFNVGKYGYKSIGIYDKHLLGKTKPLDINSFDYNFFKYINKDDELMKEDYIVYIDQYFPYHPDSMIVGGKVIPAETFYSTLNLFFDVIENRTRKKVVIAAHPKALKYKESDFFDGRKVFYNKTCTLVKNAKLVLAHSSTSIYFAIMCYKPIILLNTSLFMNYASEHDLLIHSLATRFNLDIGNIEDVIGFENLKVFTQLTAEQEEKYSLFIEEFCTLPSVKQPNEKLLDSYVNRILKA